MSVELADKVVLVSGASLGIGREIAFGFAAERARLVLTYHEHEAEAEEVAEHCRGLGSPDVVMLPLDITDEDSVRRLVAAAVGHTGGIDILVNNAGVVVWRPFLEQDFAEIEHQLDVNLIGVVKLTWLLLPHVRDAIITIGSGAGLRGAATLVPYCASKFGVRGFMKALADEHRDRRIVNVHPTVTATRMNDFRGMPPERVAEVVLRVARGEIEVPSGGDVDVREFAES